MTKPNPSPEKKSAIDLSLPNGKTVTELVRQVEEYLHHLFAVYGTPPHINLSHHNRSDIEIVFGRQSKLFSLENGLNEKARQEISGWLIPLIQASSILE